MTIYYVYIELTLVFKMQQNNLQSQKQKLIQFHSELKSQFLKLYIIPFQENEFNKMANLLHESGVDKLKLDPYFKEDGQFDFDKYLAFIKLSEQTIISLYSDISKLS